MQPSDKPLHPLFRLLLAVCCAVWIYSFMPPLEALKLLNGATSLISFLALLAVSQLIPMRAIRVLVALAAVSVYSIYWYVPKRGILFELSYLVHQFGKQLASLIWSRNMTEPLQTQLFLLMVCGMFWLVVYACTHPRLWAFYNLLAVVILGIIDGNTDVHPNASIVIDLVLFVVMLGLLQFYRFYSHLIYRDRPIIRFFFPLAALLLLASGIGLVVPKPGPVWADPLKAIDHSMGVGTGGAVKQIGFQLDNARLGGSFVMDKTPVLSVIEQDPSYLRGEVYSDYTGHGWLPGPSEIYGLGDNATLPQADLQFSASNLQAQPVQQKITVLSAKLSVPVVFGAYTIEKVSNMTTPNGQIGSGFLPVDIMSGVVKSAPLAKDETYTVTSAVMPPPDAVLAGLPNLPQDVRSAFPANIVQQYLNLPAAMPSSVGDLTKGLTAGMTSEYDMVVAVQNYLKLNYTYATDGIPVPGKNQDYVNQFLFDTKKGYCNNFSSAMAVMLRTLGIPTRWVTGFAPGTMNPNYQGKDSEFIVTNADAHSWVEVYFPGEGWIPFDPTPNFNMSFGTPVATDTPQSTPTPHVPVPPVKPPSVPQTPTGGGQSGGVNIPWSSIFRGIGYTLLGVFILGAILLYVFRVPVQDWRHARVWRRDTKDSMRRGVLHLLRLLYRYREMKTKSPTIRDLRPIAQSYGVEESEFKTFVSTFERSLYGGKAVSEEELRNARSTWMGWIRSILRRGR